MKQLFDETTGLLLLDEIVCEKESFRAITQDAVISDDEIMQQSALVISLLQKIEQELDETQRTLVLDAISELAVLYQIHSLKEGER